MIKSITLKKGQDVFTNKLYRHKSKDVKFEFNDKVNIITGRNGSGKSVLLNIIKTYCGIGKQNTYACFKEPMDIFNDFVAISN